MPLTKQQIVAEIRRRADAAEAKYLKNMSTRNDGYQIALQHLVDWLFQDWAEERAASSVVTPSVTPKKKGCK
jgi:hypothetical protein